MRSLMMSQSVLRTIIREIQQVDYFAIMLDECIDVSNEEQLTVCFRYVDDDLVIHEALLACISAIILKLTLSCQ